MRTRESDREDRGLLGGHYGERKKKAPLSSNSLRRNLSRSLSLPGVQLGRGERGFTETAQQPTGLEGSRNQQEMAPGHPYKSPEGKGVS